MTPDILRLTILSDHLRTVNRSMFSVGVNDGWRWCAVGHASDIPVFAAEGLSFKHNNHAPMFNGKVGWDAVHTFFNLTKREADFLFFNENDNIDTHGPCDIADRIDQFIAENCDE